ncbi:MAG: ORF6N domain-containing protein [Dysgonamonadaceae bacterium]|jgi:hypothetical protein|nr:ORF6N domain-containing protein [Dysgonamonadaceae bacterium]
MEQQLVQIQSKIYPIRGQKVMLDRDLAGMYGVETKVLNQAVKRNIERFEGDDFMFQLTVSEMNEFSRSQIVTLNKGRGYNIKYRPFAFTELGVAMLSSVLNSPVAIEINRKIMRAFVYIRQVLFVPPTDEVKQLQYDLKALQDYIENVFTDYNDINEDTRMQLELINEALAELQMYKKLAEKPRRRIGFTPYDDGESRNVNE